MIDKVDALATGRRAFWDGKALWANPFAGGAAERWKTGWTQAKAAFGPGPVTAATLIARRPADVPMGRAAVTRSTGAGRKATTPWGGRRRTPIPWAEV